MDLRELNLNIAQNRHPWELSRAQFFRELVRKWVPPTDHVGLDIGSGDTWLASRLAECLSARSQLTCVDKCFTPEIIAKLKTDARGLQLETSIPNKGIYDLVFLLDVVEHVENDRDFIKELLDQHVTPGGLLIISVPSFQSLFMSHDRWLGHYRRYGPASGRALIKSLNLEILADGGLFHGLLYLRAFQKLLEKLKGEQMPKGVGRWKKGETVTRWITHELNADWRFSEGLRQLGVKMPGLSWWCVCRKGASITKPH